MLQTNDPLAWQQLIELLAEHIANDIMSCDDSGSTPVLRDNSKNPLNMAPQNARNHLRSVQLRQTT